MFPESIIILAGEACSGKSSTLRELAKRFKKEPSRFIYSFRGKRICICLCSPQELLAKKDFCQPEKVMAIIRDTMIDACVSERCTLLIMTFTMKGNQETHELLNEPCIETPIHDLEKTFKVHIIHLHKNDFRKKTSRVIKRLKQIDELMRNLKNYQELPNQYHQIESHKGVREARKQADNLWKFILKVDP